MWGGGCLGWEDGLALDHCHETGGFSGDEDGGGGGEDDDDEDDDDNSGDDNKVDYGSG